MLAAVGVLSAVSYLLMLVEVATPFAPFLKYDPADVAALVAGFALGPLPGLAVVVLRNLLRCLIKPDLIGLAMNTVAGGAFVLVSATWYQARLTRRDAALGLALGGVAQTLVCVPAACVALPAYGLPAEVVWPTVTSAIVPFNVVKTGLTGALTFFLYKRVAGFLPRFRGNLYQRPPAAR